MEYAPRRSNQIARSRSGGSRAAPASDFLRRRPGSDLQLQHGSEDVPAIRSAAIHRRTWRAAPGCRAGGSARGTLGMIAPAGHRPQREDSWRARRIGTRIPARMSNRLAERRDSRVNEKPVKPHSMPSFSARSRVAHAPTARSSSITACHAAHDGGQHRRTSNTCRRRRGRLQGKESTSEQAETPAPVRARALVVPCIGNRPRVWHRCQTCSCRLRVTLARQRDIIHVREPANRSQLSNDHPRRGACR